MRFLRDNGLTLVLMAVFAATALGMLLTGWATNNHELIIHGQPSLDLATYFFSGSFQSALFENWESEFLQMAAYVMLTAVLFQRGSSESKDPDAETSPEDEDPAKHRRNKTAPWPVRAGGIWLALYSHSLGAALTLLFVLSFVLHWLNSLRAANEEALQHGTFTQDAWSYLIDAQFWFESFQNWQSEFLSTAVLVVLSIVLRHRGSPESKPVAAPHAETGH
jgi:hypothetical protein